MTGWREFWWRLRNFFRVTRSDAEMRDELAFHLEMAAEAHMKRGLSRDEAMRQARLDAGHEVEALESMRDQRGLGWLEGTAANLRRAVMTLRRQRGYAALVIGAMALAVGLNTLIFTLLDGVVLRPLPYPHPDELVRFFESSPRNPKFPVSIANFQEMQRASQMFQSFALYTGEDLQLMHGEEAERLTALRVSSGFFQTVGVAPMLGRDFQPADCLGNPRLVMISHGLWKSRFHGDANIVGSQIRLNRESWTVIGVMPAGFQHIGGTYHSPLHGDTVAAWWPLRLDVPENQKRQWHYTNAIGRLKPGVSKAQLQQATAQLNAALHRRFPDLNPEMELRAMALQDELVGRSRETVWLLAAAGFFVLLIACANVAGLAIARGIARSKEMAVCKALGAGDWRLARTVICENVVLGIAGGVLGLGLALALGPAWRALLPADFPRVAEVRPTWLEGGFAFGMALLSSLLAGIAPALRSRGVDAAGSLSVESRSSSAGRGSTRLRAVLVASELAFATVLCAGAGLLWMSAQKLSERPHGFQPANGLTFVVELTSTAYTTPEPVVSLHRRLVAKWRSLPGVRAAALVTNVPWDGYDDNSNFEVVGAPQTKDSPQGRYQMATDGYFEAMRIPLLAGRTFTSEDTEKSVPVVVVNAALERRYLGGHGVGKVLDLWGGKRQVVGVVADIRDHPSDLSAEPAYWFPATQQPQRRLKAVIQTEGGAGDVLAAASAALHELDAELPVAEVKTMDEIVRQALAERNLANRLFETFALLAVLLALVGVHGLLAYVVEQRHKEFGIRAALGATRGVIAGMVLRGGVRQALAGAAIGLALTPVVLRGLSMFLFGVRVWEPWLLAGTAIVIVGGALAAGVAPAWRAARADVSATLRAE